MAFSMSIISTLDSIKAPLVFTSATPKYLPSTDTSVSTAIIDALYVLNSSFPFLSNVIITLL